MPISADPGRGPLLQLIVPARNEQSRLPATLTELRAWAVAARESGGTPLEVIVVDNASTDGTAEVARSLSTARRCRSPSCTARPGKGAAVRAGHAGHDRRPRRLHRRRRRHRLRRPRDGLAPDRRRRRRGHRLARRRRLGHDGAAQRAPRARRPVYRWSTARLVPGIRDTQCGFKLFRGGLGPRRLRRHADRRLLLRRRGARPVPARRRHASRSSRSPGSTSPARRSTPARHGVPSSASSPRSRRHRCARPIRPRRPRRCRSCRAAPERRGHRGAGCLSPELAGRRVAVVNWRDLDHALAGGSERYAWEFAKALATAGADVDFLTARDAGQGRSDLATASRSAGAGDGSPSTPAAGGCGSCCADGGRLDVVIDPECGIPAFSPLLVAAAHRGRAPRAPRAPGPVRARTSRARGGRSGAGWRGG